MGFGYLDISPSGVYSTETRPQESGRAALVFKPHGGDPVDHVPAGFNVRTRVHEYGGGAWFRRGDVVFCSSFEDSRLYRIEAPAPSRRRSRPSRPSRTPPLRRRPRLRGGRLIVCVASPRARASRQRARRRSDRRIRGAARRRDGSRLLRSPAAEPGREVSRLARLGSPAHAVRGHRALGRRARGDGTSPTGGESPAARGVDLPAGVERRTAGSTSSPTARDGRTSMSHDGGEVRALTTSEPSSAIRSGSST